MEVTVAFVVFQLRFQFFFVRDLTVFVPPVLRIVAADVPQFRCCKPAGVKIVTNLLIVRDCGDVCASCFQHCPVFISYYERLHIKINDQRWNIRLCRRTWLETGYVGFITRLFVTRFRLRSEHSFLTERRVYSP
jgi:hypothetical protein